MCLLLVVYIRLPCLSLFLLLPDLDTLESSYVIRAAESISNK